LCLEIFALRRFFSEPIVNFQLQDYQVRMEASLIFDCK